MRRAGSDKYVLDRGGAVLAGRYRVEALLGVGAMGSVWTAEHLALKRKVVVKFHEEAFVGANAEVALRRFVREARSLASVRHRNVTELYEVGKTEEGEPYLILELLDGETLARRLGEEGRLPIGGALAIAAALCDGLDAVHAAGVLHRDVKPENVFLHRENGETVPKLLDFGLARPVRKQKRERITLGGGVGTPGYMAPEQARGEEDLDGRVDVYSVGVTLYEMLACELPFRGETATDLIIAAATEEPITLSTVRPDLGWLDDVVMKAIAARREHRLASARVLRTAIERLQRELEAPVVAPAAQRRLRSATTLDGHPAPRSRRSARSTDDS